MYIDTCFWDRGRMFTMRGKWCCPQPQAPFPAFHFYSTLDNQEPSIREGISFLWSKLEVSAVSTPQARTLRAASARIEQGPACESA